MEWIEAIILGIVQGITEFLPISSSAHLRILPELFGWQDPGAAFTAVTHLGSAVAIILYFAKDIVRIADAWLRSLLHRSSLRQDEPVIVGAGGAGSGSHRKVRSWDPADARLGWYIIIGTVPIVIGGVLLEDYIENEFRSLWIVASTFVILGIVLWLADRYGRREMGIERLTVNYALIIGVAQVGALVPGVSRAGATICMALILGFQREAAARFALLLAVPAVLGASIFEWNTAMSGESVYGNGPTLLAVVVSFIASYAAIAWLLKWLQTRTFTPFVIYRVVGGLAIIGLLAAGVLTA
jgi:undecaprenyl-diphosphatase